MSPEEIKGSEGTGGETDRIEYAQFSLPGGPDRLPGCIPGSFYHDPPFCQKMIIVRPPS